MKIRELPKNIRVVWILRAFLFFFFVDAAIKKSYLFTIVAFIAIFLSFLPSIIEKNWKLSIPWTLELLITTLLLLHMISINFRLFDVWPFWSSIIHFVATATIAVLAFLIVYTLNFTKKIRLNLFTVALFTFVFALAIGSLWEIGEFYSDVYLGTKNQKEIGKDPLTDTMYDLIYDALAGFIVAVAGVFYVRYAKQDVDGIARGMAKKR